MGSYKYCICFTRKFVWKAAAPPPDVRQTFVEYSEGAAQMLPDQLRRFLAEAQGQADATLADAERIIEVLLLRRRCHHLPAMLSRPGISLDDFFHFLFSDDLNPPIRSQVGAALPQHPKRTLWSMTLTSPVEMIKCLRSIKEFAFCASPYPVVITLEDHLTTDLQAKVAEMVTQTFGDMLYYPKSDSLEEFPSPESLKNRIIISTKPPEKYFESRTVEDKQDDLQKGSNDEAWETNTADLQALHVSHDKSLWQGYGRSLWLMQGLFRANGGCGYVRKPDFLMNIGPQAAVSNPEASLPVKITLKVKIYMGDGWHKDFSRTHFDVFSPPDFYAKIGIAGVPADIITKRTRIKQDDWTPVWGEEFSFPLTVPELALLRIEACEYNMSDMDDFGGQTCLPVWELKPGIRAVPLHDRKGNKYNSVRLLMRFQFH
ncbi:hypothetical protein C4D60_Mb01t31720 [Musa balbisiana]|uniref:phosphoinositide phospholipase C n=1 Tax=Musa balbisiana TaxID=52838 RepID=A0A4S8JS54_MUSBA|nr:hypothetical protein C4D60_Mb01t31720 [Musa balbisiana]